MKKFLIFLTAAFAAMNLPAMDLGNGFSVGGGVKTGVLIKHADFAGELAGFSHGYEKPMTLYFASQDNNAYKGEGWLKFGYAAQNWGLNLSFWSHGDLVNYSDAVHLGDHYLWANLLDQRLRFIGGQGGGTPIKTGGWINADWLGYTGLRLFWVDPVGFTLGINFPDPDDGAKAEGIKPVTYLSMIMAGASYQFGNFRASIIFDNNPIYDDSDTNYDGGLHRPPNAEPIAQSGNIAFGLGADNIFGGKGFAIFDGIVTNLGEDNLNSPGSASYTISPVITTLALKAGYPVLDELYTELKIRYTAKQGDNAERDASTLWGKLEFEPYASYRIISNLKFEIAINYTQYINSYYLAIPVTPNVTIGSINDKWAAPYPSALDYYSYYLVSVKPAFVYSFSGVQVLLGYNGEYSRDHVENTLFVDFRWSF